MTNRARQARETRARLAQVALDLIRRDGYDEVTVGDICRSAGVSVGAFYHHFPSKEHIIVEVYSEIDEYFAEEVAPRLGPDPVANIHTILTEQLAYAERFGVQTVTQIYKAQLFAGRDFFASMERELPSLLRVQVERAVADRNVGLTPLEVTEAILNMSRGMIYNWCLREWGLRLGGTGRENL